MKLLATSVFLLLFSSGFAEETASPIKFIGTASGRDNSNASDITNPVKWGDGKSELSSELDYIVDNGKYCGFGGTGAFPGKSLTLGVVGGNSGNLGVTTASDFNFGTLILNKGTLSHKIKSETITVTADITVNAAFDNPYVIQFNGAYNGRMEFRGSIQGAGSLRISTSSQDKEYMLARIKSDLSAFTGTIKIGPDSTAASVKYRSPVLFGDGAAGGEIVVNPCGVVGPCGNGDNLGEFSVKKLSLYDGSTVRFGVNATTGGTIRVVEKLTMPEAGKVTLDVTALPNSCLAGRRHPVMIAPAGTGLDTEAFVLKAVNKVGSELNGKLVACSLAVDYASDGEILYLVMDKYTCLKSDESWGESGWTADYSQHWYDVPQNTPIMEDVIYINYYQQMTSPTSEFTFGGGKLVISFSSWGLLFAAQKITIPDLVMANNGQLRFWNTEIAHLYGGITLVNPDGNGYSMTIANARKYTVYIHSDISGAGAIRVFGSNERTGSRTDNPSATVYLKGDNSALSGRIYVTNVQNDPATNMTLCISDVRQLGGAMPKFTYNGIGFANWSRFRADESLNLAEPTRGVYFVGGNYVSVPSASHTLTLGSQTTFAGTVVKEGKGTLSLGGVLKFTKDQGDMPLEGTNVLRVSAGRISPASKTGADGLAIAFAEGTGLRLAPLAETADADVVRYGLYNVKWAEPFDLTASGGKLDVALDLPETEADIPAKFSFGVCTVAASAADALEGNIVISKIKGRKCAIEAEDNGDGSVTFTAKCEKPGLVFTVR